MLTCVLCDAISYCQMALRDLDTFLSGPPLPALRWEPAHAPDLGVEIRWLACRALSLPAVRQAGESLASGASPCGDEEDPVGFLPDRHLLVSTEARDRLTT